MNLKIKFKTNLEDLENYNKNSRNITKKQNKYCKNLNIRLIYTNKLVQLDMKQRYTMDFFSLETPLLITTLYYSKLENINCRGDKMIEETKYPIKYAVLELTEKCGDLAGYWEMTTGYIVSKCYVVGTKIEYFSDGSKEITHSVVFPYTNLFGFRTALENGLAYNENHTVPSRDYHNKYYPTKEVECLFDNYDDAKELAQMKNEELKQKILCGLSASHPNWKTNYLSTSSNFEMDLIICKMFEEKISLKTTEMVVTKSLEGEVGEKRKILKK